MVATPKITGPDGVSRETLVFSTTLPSRFFRGVIDPSTVDMQISIRGAAFTSDPDLIVFEGSSFYFPNPSAYPEGLELAQGENVVLVRSIGFDGNPSPNAEVRITLVQESDIGLIGAPPTNFFVEQRNDAVQLQIEGISDSRFVGINLYASRFQGGGATGYQRINVDIISDFDTVEEEQVLQQFEATSSIAKNPDGSAAADPLYLEIQETQTKSNDVIERLEDVVLTEELAAAITETAQANLLKTDFTRVFEIPETVNTLRTSYSLSSVVTRRFYGFLHNRLFGPANVPPTVPIGEFQSLSNTEPLFYVATAVYYDSSLLLEIESSFSIEISGKPVQIQDVVGTFPAPSRIQIVEDVIASLRTSQPTVNIAPGGVIRDTFVDPFSNEASRLRLLTDFVYRSQSFDTLLAIDGVEANGTSTPVNRSAYKSALQRVFDVSNPQDVQTIIDTTFEQLASRNNVFRRPGVRSRGVVTFFTRNKPTATVFIPLGTRVSSGAITFSTTADASMPLSNIASFFNPTTGIYSVDVPVQAEQAGISGNLAPGQIRTIISSLPGLSVTNASRTFGGKNQDTNLRLTERARSALASVDTGTEQGTRQVAADVAGVEEALVVEGGDPLMQRDYDPDYGKHVGGKIDVWVRGESIGRITDTFAFTFETANDVQFVLVGNPNQLVLRALDKNLSPTNPLAEMINRPDLGLGLRNANTGQFFDLTDVIIQDYRTIQLSTAFPQPEATFGNVLLGDYRYQTTSDFQFTRQPVQNVVSVVGQLSGDLPDENYALFQPSDPLLEGRSEDAGDFLRIFQVNGVPSGDTISVTAETHVPIGEFDEFVSNLGANPLTVRVFNSSRAIEFRGPNDPSGLSDYTIIPGSATTALAIRRTPNSQIRSGETVSIDYDHVENFTVTYETNFVVTTTQAALDQTKHATADVLVKEAIPVPVDVTATVILQAGTSRSGVDSRLRTNLVTFINSLRQGASIRQSDIINVIENTVGVSYVETPLTKLLRGEGARVVREEITTASSNDSVLLLGNPLTPLSSSTVQVFLLTDSLNSSTLNGGGPETDFRGVYQDDQPLNLKQSDPFSLVNAPGQAYIIGKDGLSIPGYSDNDTIQNQFPTLVTAQDINNKRVGLTANRVMVSVGIDDRPQLHDYTVTYTVAFVESGVKNLDASVIEYFVPGNFILTYTEDARGNQ